jgi:hypothetical protein
MIVRAIRESASLFRVEVDDPSPLPPVLQDPGPHDEGGRGLRIVDSFADDWGVRPLEHGKTVWFTIDSTTAKEEVHEDEEPAAERNPAQTTNG